MSDFKTFMSIPNASVAKEIIDIFETQKMDFKLQDTAKDFDASMANNEAKNSILIMLDPKDFEAATVVLEQHTKFDIAEIDPQHPLYTFSIEELKEVVKNYDEWHPIDVKLAKYLLNKQDIIVAELEIKEQQHLKELKSYDQEKSSSTTLWMGYLFCLLGGLAGIGIALFLLTAKKKMHDGTKKYIYSNSDRNHGLFMLLAGGIVFTLLILK